MIVTSEPTITEGPTQALWAKTAVLAHRVIVLFNHENRPFFVQQAVLLAALKHCVWQEREQVKFLTFLTPHHQRKLPVNKYVPEPLFKPLTLARSGRGGEGQPLITSRCWSSKAISRENQAIASLACFVQGNSTDEEDYLQRL